MNYKNLFNDLYFSKNEQDLDKVILKNSAIFDNPQNWRPLGGHENNFGVIENQQASPIAALIEKITNSIDATFYHYFQQLYYFLISFKQPTIKMQIILIRTFKYHFVII